jgi:hypothetical protein
MFLRNVGEILPYYIVIFQKTVLFVTTVVRNSNPTNMMKVEFGILFEGQRKTVAKTRHCRTSREYHTVYTSLAELICFALVMLAFNLQANLSV